MLTVHCSDSPLFPKPQQSTTCPLGQKEKHICPNSLKTKLLLRKHTLSLELLALNLSVQPGFRVRYLEEGQKEANPDDPAPWTGRQSLWGKVGQMGFQSNGTVSVC